MSNSIGSRKGFLGGLLFTVISILLIVLVGGRVLIILGKYPIALLVLSSLVLVVTFSYVGYELYKFTSSAPDNETRKRAQEVASERIGEAQTTSGRTKTKTRVTELSATSETGFEDAINEAVARATMRLGGIQGAWVKDQNVMIEGGDIKGYKVNLEVTFVLED